MTRRGLRHSIRIDGSGLVANAGAEHCQARGQHRNHNLVAHQPVLHGGKRSTRATQRKTGPDRSDPVSEMPAPGTVRPRRPSTDYASTSRSVTSAIGTPAAAHTTSIIAAGVTLLVILVILLARIVLRIAGSNGGRTIS